MATFDQVGPDNVIRYEYKWNTIKNKSESGIEYRRSKQASGEIVWRLSFTTLTKTEANYIIDFFNARRGEFEAFTWPEPLDGSTANRNVRFLGDTLPPIRHAYGVYSIDLTLIKVK